MHFSFCFFLWNIYLVAKHYHVSSFLGYGVFLDHGLEFFIYSLRDFKVSKRLNDADIYMQDIGLGI